MPMSLDSSNELRFTKLLSALSEYKASDLHFTLAAPPTLRIGDKMIPLPNEDMLNSTFIENVAFSMLTDEQARQFELKKSVIFIYNFKGRARYKVHCYMQSGHVAVSFRYITEQILPLSRLNVCAAVRDLITLDGGLLLITGDHGSGKSTLLAGFVEERNQTLPEHIVTFEDPVEHTYVDAKAMIEQISLGKDLPGLVDAIEFVTHEDVDTIVVSAPLDAANIRIVLQMATMGKLVICELTATSVRTALERIVNTFTASEHSAIREQLASVMRAAVAVRLQATMSGSLVQQTEVLRSTPAVVNFLRHESFDKMPLILENGRNDGMVTFEQSAQELQTL
jgi:twitching motility protein PilT